MNKDVVIVGAGAAGIGLAVALKDFGVTDFVVLDRHEIGASFARWPREMRLITPSFNSTPFGVLDLNAVALNTSVANFIGSEHPTGLEYTRYLQALAKTCELPVQIGVEVFAVSPEDGGGFLLETNHENLRAKFVVWAAGEFQFPRSHAFPGADLCVHTSLVSQYRDLPGEERIVIGAFESGIDAAVNLAGRGVAVTLLNAGPVFATTDEDPSRSLSPFTRARLTYVLNHGTLLHVRHSARAERVTRGHHGAYVLTTSTGETFSSRHPPLLATGFSGGLGPVGPLFASREDGATLLSEDDESTRFPGLFLAGPLVRHDHHVFCYIYKFRQRFAVIAETLAERLNIAVPDELLETYERNQMRLVDLSCCGAECLC